MKALIALEDYIRKQKAVAKLMQLKKEKEQELKDINIKLRKLIQR